MSNAPQATPGPGDFHAVAELHHRFLTGLILALVLRAGEATAAEAVYRLARRPRAIAVLPWMMRYSVWLNNMVPGLVDKIMERRFVKPERGL